MKVWHAVTMMAVIILGGSAFVGALAWWGEPSATQKDMERVETLLRLHGYAVEGFAATPAPDLELVDAIAPKGCVDIWRTAHLAQLAIVRMIPAHAAESGAIGAAAAIATAHDEGRLDCVGLAPEGLTP